MALVFVMGLALGWMLGLDSGKKSVQESERAYWMETVQGLEKGLALAKAKAQVQGLVSE